MKQTATAEQVKAALYNKGTTLKGWCSDHEFNYRTTLNAVNRHTSGNARQPWGPLTRKILSALEKETGFQLLPN